MKSIIITTLALIFGLIFFFYRRRLKLAFQVAGGLYVALTVVRFIFYADDSDRVGDFGLVIAILGAVWLLTNAVTAALERRRRRARR